MSISLPQVTVGQQTELWRILGDAGLTGEDVQRILRDRTLAEHMVAELRRRKPLGNERLFSSCEDILASFRLQAVKREWPFGAEVFDYLHNSMPGFPTDRLKAACLKIWLGSLEETATELWEWAKSAHNYQVAGGAPADVFGDVNLRLLNPDRYTAAPTVQWEVIDLSSAWGEEPAPAEPGKIRKVEHRVPADLEIFTVAALHPQYIREQNGRDIPFMTMGGACFHPDYGSRPPHVLRLGWMNKSQKLWLHIADPYSEDQAFVAPVIV